MSTAEAPRTYPRAVEPAAIFSQHTLDRLTTSILCWQQGAGQVGGLYLHACWGETSVLSRRYQGQTTHFAHALMHGAMRLFEVTGERRWQRMAADVVSNLLYLQAANGGFIHASAEAEPTYVPEITCPIHQFYPIVTLLDYAAWEHAWEPLRAEVRPAIDRHLQWAQGRLWRSGNAWQRAPLKFAGWCGVTNQDLVAIASLALYGRQYGDWSRFHEQGEPSLEVFLGPTYHHRDIGLMERGDSENFAERTAYYGVILPMLERIRTCTGDDRLLAVSDNIASHLFDAAFTWDDGQTHLSWGAETWPADKTSIRRWIRTPITLGAYPTLLPLLRGYLVRHPDGGRQAIVERLESTLASYVFGDGTMPGALGAADAVFAIATSPASGSLELWRFLLERLGTAVRSPAHAPAGPIHRRRGNMVWKTNGRLWALEVDGLRRFAGLAANPGAILLGPDESLAGADLAELEVDPTLEMVRF